MTHTVSGKLHKAPFIKTLTDSTMFAIKLSESTKSRDSDEKIYANYDAIIFAKSQGQIDFYTNATAIGSFVVVSCEKLQPKISDCGKYVNLSMENARLENASYGESGAQPKMTPVQQPAPAYQPAPPPKMATPQQQVLITADDQLWIDSVRANPAMINEIVDTDYRARIQSLV